MELEFFASCLGGLEQALAQELKTFGISRTRPLKGGVAFFCTQEGAYRACLWSRLASRIVLVIGRVNAGDAGLLYTGLFDIPWEDVLASDATFAVRARGTNDELRNTRFTALKAKDAVVDRLRAFRNERPQVDTKAPRASIEVRIRERRATVSLDLSGEALNHRPYLLPDDKKGAPYECSLAAAALALGGWPDAALRGSALVDPACRDGILLVEAASMACDQAPGLLRRSWGFPGWARHDRQLWDALLEEAHDRFKLGLERVSGQVALDGGQPAPDMSKARFVGTSTSSPSISRARKHVRQAGLRPVASVELADASSVGDAVRRASANADRVAGVRSCAVASYIDAGSRVDARAQVQADEAAFAAACAAASEADTHDEQLFIAIDGEEVSTRFDVGQIDRFKVGQGRIEVPIEVFRAHPRQAPSIEVVDLDTGVAQMIGVCEPGSEQFAARLRKVFKERRKWAAREDITCYRIYDADLPEYAVAIDWYAGAGEARGNSYLHIAEYAAPSSVDADRARRRFNDVLAIAPIVCGVRPDHVFSKRRLRDKGGSQYRRGAERPYVTTVQEGGYLFEVDLAKRLDTGLFLDHRLTRGLIRDKAEGARFLNLFAYTGAGSVYAAGGGAKSTTTVDLSQNYLDWAQRNMAANGFAGKKHEFVHADVLRWITEARRARKRYDLIFADPPTFSNSKSMGKKTWDVQRDHVELLIGIAHLLSEGGLAVFSCNLRSFKPHYDDLRKHGIELEDISIDTIPYDYARTPKIHKCYLMRTS